ncbi:hypothetical protein BD324DRAFT_653802 [Kockovaella imperatae]|uniref:LIM zinc-binding domain-containing protein n=1 Tax=Kockovaella imperatae TaxID=4999 RepID=A0A1Y1U6T2_9TREE|nr:hypothetical protein BD324DRAFT_653802 [Kockovaella imperatae]ORX33749.1 hypothetical protein BD324DRAFT_653802 [Kockovaella imperatae]
MPGLLIPPVPVDHERASMVLPTIKCSSCGDPISLAAMADHICRPPSRSAKASRNHGHSGAVGGSSRQHAQHHYDDYDAPLPSPSSSYSHSRPTPQSSSRRHERERERAPVRPAYGGPLSPPGGGLQIPPMSSSTSSSSRLSPHSASSHSRSPSPHTPSPTNPFFPAQATEHPDQGLSVFGLGFNSASVRPEGPFPNDRPLPAGVSELFPLGDAKASSGAGGMAGVGRRAFQAAAWGVTAGVAMAAGARSKTAPIPTGQPPSVSSAPRSAGAIPTSRPPWEQQNHHPIQPPPRSNSHSQSSHRPRGGTEPRPADLYPPRNDVPPRSASAVDKRQHAIPITPRSPPRATTHISRSVDNNHGYVPVTRHQHSGSLSSHTSVGSPDPGISNLLRSRANERTPKTNTKTNGGGGAFFDRYKQMQSSNDSSRALGVGRKPSDQHGRSRQIVDSPQPSAYDLDDAYEDMDGPDSALPWATPQLEDSPEIKQNDKLPRQRNHPSKLNHQRHRPGDSETSSNSSGSRRYEASGPESEEIVTPSTSFEGLADRMQGSGRREKASKDRYGYDHDDDDRRRRDPVAPARKGSGESREKDRSKIQKSNSNSTIKAPGGKSRNPPEDSPDVPSSRSRPTPKTCQKCGETVGGSRKFVERDGVVLCEADWKKMYLPTCRKCQKLIETKMVSADDGQLKGKWHASCFTCSRCDKPFEGKDFYVHAGRPWCQYHYAKETGTLCASSSCKKPIEGPCIVVQGSSNPLRFHPGHLRCDHRDSRGGQSCREAMDEYFDVDGKRYCDRHVGEALKAASAASGGKGGRTLKAEKRKTRLVDLPSGGW